MTSHRSIALAVALLGALAMNSAALAAKKKPSAADKAWVAKCIDQLKLNPNPKIIRKYCVCMHGFYEDNDDVSQSDMEHQFPPAHVYCNRVSGWK